LITDSNSGNEFDIHRLVQLVTYSWLLKKGEAKEWAEKAFDIMAGMYPKPNFANLKTCGLYLPHALTVIGYSEHSDESAVRATLLHHIANYLMTQRRRRVLGEDHPDTLDSTFELMLILADLSRWEEAEKLGARVIEMRRRVLGEEDPDMLTTLSYYMVTYRQGRLKEGLEIAESTMEKIKRTLGEEHRVTLLDMHNLAVILYDRGRLEEAEALVEQTIAMKKSVMGEEHPQTLISSTLLAFIWGRDDRRKKGLELTSKTADMLKLKLGMDNRHTIFALDILDRWKASSTNSG
jgi:tetratricopeptide (TPR) repeat protein